MKREILINANPRETRVAISRTTSSLNFWSTVPKHRRMVGDIYLGRVEAVLPGIQAAFVDIGTEKSAFLHASDLVVPRRREPTTTPTTTMTTTSAKAGGEERQRPPPARRAKAPRDSGRSEARAGHHRPGLQGADLHQGPARHRAGLARRTIPRLHARRRTRRRQPQDRRRAERASACANRSRKCCPKNSGGVIVRTVGEDVTQETLRARAHDAHRPVEEDQAEDALSSARPRWSTARRASRAASSATCSAPRSSRLTVDSKQVYNEIVEYLKGIAPELIDRVKLYEDAAAAVRQARRSNRRSATCSSAAATCRPAAT